MGLQASDGSTERLLLEMGKLNNPCRKAFPAIAHHLTCSISLVLRTSLYNQSQEYEARRKKMCPFVGLY